MRRTHRRLRRAIFGGAAGAFAALFCVLIGPVTAVAATTTAWRADGYGPGNTGYNPIETEINTGTVASLDYRWSAVSPVVRFACSRQSAPVVADNRLFLTDQGGFAAYNATTGARLWTYRFADPTDARTPRLNVVGSRVFAAVTGCQSVSDPNGDLRAFNASTGALLWSVSRDAPMFGMVVDKDVVLVSGEDVGGSQVTAYRATDGALLWSRAANLVRAVSANGRVLINPVDEDGSTTGSELVDIRTGAALWTSTTVYSIQASGPAGGPLYATGPGASLVRINVETGAVVWSVPGATGLVSTDGPRLYVAQGSTLVARDAATGAEVWSHASSSPLGKPVIAGGVVYNTVSGRGVEPLDAATGANLDFDAPFGGVVDHPVIVNGRFYVTTGRVLDAFAL
jgi:outer membrane protein assembly factor BamB